MKMPIQTIGNAGTVALVPTRGASDTPEVRATQSAGPAPASPANDPIARAIDAVNRMLDPMARGLQFSVDQATGETVVKLVDNETGEVLREMPSREMVAIAHALDSVKGILIRAKA
jgi:flagellar protein FlaG